MTSREDILTRVREKVGRNVDDTALARGDMEAWLNTRRQGPRPPAAGDLLARFREKSEALSTSIDIVAEWSTVPSAVARYLAERSLAKTAVGWPLLTGHDWAAAGIAFEGRGARDADRIGITGAFCAIAETGTLVLLSGHDTPASVSLLPETHVAVVAASRIVMGMEEAWNLLRAKGGALPRAVNFVSGPSRTGDIEQTIVLGAHGPYQVHVIVVTGA
ncbi:MAG: lactate utilization protein C [Gammaproteobacteria bacterium]|nr:lactate utilization protein C [Gammaproteobacteria bacterium]MBU1415608.1 lactate utilization protein C [Gammaproteobacteria bacterium]